MLVFSMCFSKNGVLRNLYFISATEEGMWENLEFCSVHEKQQIGRYCSTDISD